MFSPLSRNPPPKKPTVTEWVLVTTSAHRVSSMGIDRGGRRGCLVCPPPFPLPAAALATPAPKGGRHLAPRTWRLLASFFFSKPLANIFSPYPPLFKCLICCLSVHIGRGDSDSFSFILCGKCFPPKIVRASAFPLIDSVLFILPQVISNTHSFLCKRPKGGWG